MASFRQGLHILFPCGLVKVNREKPTGLVVKHWVDTEGMPTLQVVQHGLVVYWDEGLVRTFSAFYLGLAANVGCPFVEAGRGISFGPLVRIYPELGENIGAATKEASEQHHFLGRSKGRRSRRSRFLDRWWGWG